MSVTFTPRSADRITKITQWAEKEIGLKRDPSGTSLPADVVYVLTTSGTATSGLYPGKVVLYDANADTWREFGTVKLKSANSETLSNSTRYAARYTGTTSGGDDVFTVLQGGGGGLTAEEADGSPSYTGVTKLQFDQADGFVLSNPATGTVKVDMVGCLTVKENDGSPSYMNIGELRLDQDDGFALTQPSANVAKIDMLAATRTQAGIVSTTSQNFDGLKSFYAGLATTEIYLGSLSASYQAYLTGSASGTGTKSVVFSVTNPSSASGGSTIECTTNIAGLTMQRIGSTENVADAYIGSNGFSSNKFPVPGSSTNPGIGATWSTNTPKFYCYEDSWYSSGGGQLGVYGKRTDGLKTAGGIVTAIGSAVSTSSSWMGF